MKKKTLVIGLDFDGVICDTGAIHAKKFAEFIIKAKGDKKLCEEMLHEEYANHPEYTLNAKPISGAIKYIRMFLKQGHQIRVVTSRGRETLKTAVQWLQNHNLSLDIIGVDGLSKAQGVKGCDIFLDDFTSVLKLLPKVPHLFLYSKKYNRYDVLPLQTRRINSWKNFYKEITKLIRK